MPTISNFSSMINQRGVSKLNKFYVDFSGITAVKGVWKNDTLLRDMSMMVRDVTWPGRILGTFQWSPNYGVLTDMPTTYSNDPVTMTFLCPADYQVRYLFDSWLHAIVNPDSWKISYPQDYKCNLGIIAVNEMNNMAYRVQITDAFPKNVQGITFSQESSELTTFIVEWAYNDFETTPTAASGSNKWGGGDNWPIDDFWRKGKTWRGTETYLDKNQETWPTGGAGPLTGTPVVLDNNVSFYYTDAATNEAPAQPPTPGGSALDSARTQLAADQRRLIQAPSAETIPTLSAEQLGEINNPSTGSSGIDAGGVTF